MSASYDLICGVLPFNRVDNVLHDCLDWCPDREVAPADLLAFCAAVCPDHSIVFPSHFFEHPRWPELLATLRGTSEQARIRFQISPGAELSLLKEDLLALDPNMFGIDIVFDRKPHQKDLESIQQLGTVGFAVRWIYYPRRGIPFEREVASLSEEIRCQTFLLIPEARKSNDFYYSHDEALLLCRKLTQSGMEPEKQAISYWIPITQTALGATARLGYAVSPQRYRENFERLGQAALFRNVVKFATDRPAGVLTLDLLEHLVQALYEPGKGSLFSLGTSIKAIFQNLAYVLIQRPYWRIYPLILRSISRLRDAISKIYWVQYAFRTRAYGHVRALGVRLYWLCYSLGSRLYWATVHATRALLNFTTSPVGTTKLYFPLFYWIVIFPVLKIYWFIEFQVKKRIDT